MAKRGKGIPGLSFSASRALGVSTAKRRIAKATGIPTTRAGRQRKVGRALGCCVMLAIPSVAFAAAILMVAVRGATGG